MKTKVPLLKPYEMQGHIMVRRDYSGTGNPNYKNGGIKICTHCHKEFKNYGKRKFCSLACYWDSKPPKKEKETKAKVEAHHKECAYCGKLFKCSKTSKKTTCSTECSEKKRESKALYTNCLQCKKPFRIYPSSKKMYCSYSCHLDSGGAWRAGLAAMEAKLKYGAKKDANHDEVVDAMKKVGASVIDMSHVGKGFPDLIVGFRSMTILMEIKNPKTSYGKRGLNKNQLKWREGWIGGAYAVVDSPEAALRAIGLIDKIALE